MLVLMVSYTTECENSVTTYPMAVSEDSVKLKEFAKSLNPNKYVYDSYEKAMESGQYEIKYKIVYYIEPIKYL